MQGLIVNTSRGLEPLSGGGWLVDESLFRFLVHFEIQKAQRLRYSVALVCLEVEPPSGANGESEPASLAGTIVPSLRGTDAVAPWNLSSLALLLIDAETDHLLAIIDRLTRRLQMATWSAGASCYPRTAAHADVMLRQALDSLTRAKEEGGNRLYVAS